MGRPWSRVLFLLMMGIPTNTEIHDDTRVMYGNPFDNTITIEKNGKLITEKVDKRCGKCNIIHLGRCMKKVSMKRGRWFLIEEEEMECRMCGGKYRGGSTRRPGRSGLIGHIRYKVETCGKNWERVYWEDKLERWNDWDEEFQMGLVVKWVELKQREVLGCNECGKSFKTISGVKEHLRREDACYERMVKVVLDFSFVIFCFVWVYLIICFVLFCYFGMRESWHTLGMYCRRIDNLD